MSSSRGASKKPNKLRLVRGGLGRRNNLLPATAPFVARLTIKPGSPRGPTPQLVLLSKPRPGGPRRLSDAPLDEDELLIDAFEATLQVASVRITAVLERTCVYVDRDANRRPASKKDVWVEADKLPIRRRGVG